MAQLKADKLNSQYLTTDEWNFNINQSSNRLYDLLITKYGDKYFFAPPLIFQTTGVNVYPVPNGANYPSAGVFPPALYKLSGIDVSSGAASANNGNSWFTIPPFNWIDRNRYNTLQLAGTVTSVFGLSYCWQGSQIYFIPYPTNAQAIQLWYIPILTQLLKDTDMMSFSISGWSELVIVDAAIKALVKEESYEQAQALVTERTALIMRVEETAANRDVGVANTVSNTRGAAGDPNFGFVGSWSSGGFGPNWGNG
jgi:cytochrome c-type biogenesis protein CcmH/NrfF